MAATFTVDFSEVLEPGSPSPAFAVADIIPISANNIRGQKRISLVLKLQGKKTQVAREFVPPGKFLVRVKAPTGEELVEHVEVALDDQDPAIVFERPEDWRVLLDEDGEEDGGSVLAYSYTEKYVPQEVVDSERYALSFDDFDDALFGAASNGSSQRPRSDRSRWSAVPVTKRNGPATLAFLPDLRVKEIVQPRQGYTGVVRLLGSASVDVWLRPDVSSMEAESERLVGDIQVMQAAKLRDQDHVLSAKWKLPLNGSGRRKLRGHEGRFFALSYTGVDGVLPRQLACIPGEWTLPSGKRVDLQLTLQPNYWVADSEPYSLKLAIDDPDVAAMLSTLQAGDAESMLKLFAHAHDALYWKYRNAFAAAVGGYVLLYAGFRDREEAGLKRHPWVGRNPWGHWIYNLARDFQGLPDGMILYATLLLQGPRAERKALRETERSLFCTAFDAAMEAIRRGPPLYRFGLKFMASNLRILAAGVDAASNDGRKLALAQEYVQDLSLRVDATQPFCVFDVVNEH